MPDEVRAKNHLAYYWYMEGSYSEVIEAGIHCLVSKKVIREERTSTAVTYSLAPEYVGRSLVSGDDIEQVKDVIRQITVLSGK